MAEEMFHSKYHNRNIGDSNKFWHVSDDQWLIGFTCDILLIISKYDHMWVTTVDTQNGRATEFGL